MILIQLFEMCSLRKLFSYVDNYKKRLYSHDVVPYPTSLPTIPYTARRRTKSAHEANIAKKELRKKQLQEEVLLEKTMQELNDANQILCIPPSNQVKQIALMELNNLMQLNNFSSETYNSDEFKEILV